MNKYFTTLAFTAFAMTASAQSNEITIANAAQDPILAQWLSNSTVAMRNQVPAMMKQGYVNAPEAEKLAIPSGAACLQKMTDFLQTDHFTPVVLKTFDASSQQEKQMDLAFIRFLHTDDGQKFMAQQTKASEALAKSLVDSNAKDSSVDHAFANYQNDLKATQDIILKQKNAKEINIGQFGLSLMIQVATEKEMPNIMNVQLEKIKAEPECQAMQKESAAYEASQNKHP